MSIEGQDPEPDDIRRVAKRVEMLERRIDSRCEELETMIQQHEKRVRNTLIQGDDLREDVLDLQQEVGELRSQLNLMELVENSDDLDHKQRRYVLFQHLKNLARKNQASGQGLRAAVDFEEAISALHHPEIDRTTVYNDLRKVADIAGDERVCWYESGSPGPAGNEARVVLDLDRAEDVELEEL